VTQVHPVMALQRKRQRKSQRKILNKKMMKKRYRLKVVKRGPETSLKILEHPCQSQKEFENNMQMKRNSLIDSQCPTFHILSLQRIQVMIPVKMKRRKTQRRNIKRHIQWPKVEVVVVKIISKQWKLA